MASSRSTKKKSTSSKKSCDDYPESIGGVYPDVYRSFKLSLEDVLDDDYFEPRSTSKKTSGLRVKAPPPRTTRSSRRNKQEEEEEEDDDEVYVSSSRTYKKKLDEVFSDFARPVPDLDRREGNSKFSYNYLLLDSRKANKAKTLDQFEDAVIYVGKGKNNRALSHIKDAEKIRNSNGQTTNKRTNKILDVWDEGGAVMVYKPTQNVTAEEAFTREAFMIEKLRGKRNNCNIKGGEYYGVASTMTPKEKKEIGAALLTEAKKDLAKKGAEYYY